MLGEKLCAAALLAAVALAAAQHHLGLDWHYSAFLALLGAVFLSGRGWTR
jgi:hypothetical protein